MLTEKKETWSAMKMLTAWFFKTEIVTKTESSVTQNFCFDFFDFISWVVE